MDTPLENGSLAGQTPQGQSPEASTPPQAPKKSNSVNLYDLPEFRQYQGKMEKAYQAALARIQTLETKDLDPEQKAGYEAMAELEQLRAEVTEHRQEKQRMAIEATKRRDVERLAALSGASVDDLMEAKSYDEAMEIALKYANSRQTKALEADSERKQANTSYIPTGSPSTPRTRKEELTQKALEARDGISYIRAMESPD